MSFLFDSRCHCIRNYLHQNPCFLFSFDWYFTTASVFCLWILITYVPNIGTRARSWRQCLVCKLFSYRLSVISLISIYSTYYMSISALPRHSASPLLCCCWRNRRRSDPQFYQSTVFVMYLSVEYIVSRQKTDRQLSFCIVRYPFFVQIVFLLFN